MAISLRAQNDAAGPVIGRIEVVQGKLEILRNGAAVWDATTAGVNLYGGDQLRVATNSRAVVRWSDQTPIELPAGAQLEVESRSSLNLVKGLMNLLHFGKSAKYNVRTPTAKTAVRGTEFVITVGADQTTTVSMLDGEVELSNDQGTVTLHGGEEGSAAPGKRPERTARLWAVNIVQWALYYPGVLDLGELSLPADADGVLKDSLTAYRNGDLPGALRSYPTGRQPATAEESIYRAGLLLAVGEVESAEDLINRVKSAANTPARAKALGAALEKLIASVRLRRDDPVMPPPASNATASEWLAESYYQQARSYDLPKARDAARRAVEKSPNFSFAWGRLAEVEFGFGRVREARAAVDNSLRLAPGNAQAVAMKGFLLAAENKISEATQEFDRAIKLDGALPNGWLGRGLCRIRRGDAEGGLQDLQMAVTLEPQRAVLRSYLGKAFANQGDHRRAFKELDLSRKLDANDPTAFLYSALLKQQESRINEAVRDLEESQRLNNNRRLYRSRLLLDEDRATRGANLASVYQDAGMIDLSVREAVHAVNADYANYSAHLFLAESYGALRDPHLADLRYETPALNEYLLANLLADSRAGTLSPYVTEQEYSKLLERDHFGFTATATWFSRGDWLQTAAQYGIFDSASYAVEESYSSFNGQRVNDDLDQILTSVKWKQHLTPQDSVYLQGIYSDANYGDLRQLYDPNSANGNVRYNETQEPLMLVGYHHEWSPGSHTLFLGGRLQDTLRVNPRGTNAENNVLALFQTGGQVLALPADMGPGGSVIFPSLPPDVLDYRSEFEAYTAELQHIWQVERHAVIAGARYQHGTFDTAATLGDFGISGVGGLLGGSLTTNFFGPPPLGAAGATNNVRSYLERWSGYGYYQVKPLDSLQAIAGVSYDWLEYPSNFRNPPVSNGQRHTDQFSPKAGLIWTVSRLTTLRGAYTRSLGGVSFDQSFRLEPSQVGGFNQAFRSLIPESVAGAVSAPRFETWGVALDQKFDTRTYVGVEGNLLRSKADRNIGVFSIDSAAFPLQSTPSVTREDLKYRESDLLVTINQLIANDFSVGARYRLSDCTLTRRIPAIPVAITSAADNRTSATLHQLSLFGLFNHPSGFFGSMEGVWWSQDNRDYQPALAGDEFWQLNGFIGYRLPYRRAQVTLGLLNMTDRDYHLNPLNLTAELPRGRTLVVDFRMNF